MSTRRYLLACLPLVVVSVAAAGCAAKNNGGEAIDAQDAADSNEANASSAQQTHFSELFVTHVTSSDPQQAADANVAATQLWPASCATRAKDPTNPRAVIVTFADCTGPFGLVHVSGKLIATFSAGASGGLHVDVTSVGLTANGHAVTETGAGDVTISGASRTVAWKGEWQRVNDKGEVVTHTTDATVVVDTAAECRTTDGTAKTTVGDREIDSTMNGYRICKLPDGADACPTGEITHTRAATGRTLTIDFDGSSEAKVTGSRGGSISVPLVCTAK